MQMTERDLRQLFRKLTTSDPLRVGCPGSDVLFDLATGELTAEQKREVVPHVAECSDCARELQSLSSRPRPAEPEQREQPAPGIAVVGRGKSPSFSRWTPAAAAVALVMAGAWLVLRPAAPPQSIERSAGRIVRDVFPADDSNLDAPPERLDWPDIEDAHGYRVRILDAEGTELLSRQLGETSELELSPDEQLLLAPGQSYLWVVDVNASSPGERLGPYWFRIET